jgi:hypothetical protein
MVPKNKKDNESSKDEEKIEFPFNSPYDDLITGETLTKRGAWWTAVLLVKSKEKTEDDAIETKKTTSQKGQKRKIIIQRWQKIKRKKDEESEEGSEFWMRKKDFTLSKKEHWNDLKRIVDSWIEKNEWNEN